MTAQMVDLDDERFKRDIASVDSKIEAELGTLIEDMRPMIAAAEKLSTTQYNYGYYLQILGSQEGHKRRLIFAYVLRKAGGSPQGIAHALRILGEV